MIFMNDLSGSSTVTKQSWSSALVNVMTFSLHYFEWLHCHGVMKTLIISCSSREMDVQALFWDSDVGDFSFIWRTFFFLGFRKCWFWISYWSYSGRRLWRLSNKLLTYLNASCVFWLAATPCDSSCRIGSHLLFSRWCSSHWAKSANQILRMNLIYRYKIP